MNSMNTCRMCNHAFKKGDAKHKASCGHIFHKKCCHDKDAACPLCGKKINNSRKGRGTKRKKKTKSKTKSKRRRGSIY